MPLSAGAKLGPYEILAPLGSGGMGEVYRARDGRLAREVALKVLPVEVATDPIRHARFEQEPFVGFRCVSAKFGIVAEIHPDRPHTERRARTFAVEAEVNAFVWLEPQGDGILVEFAASRGKENMRGRAKLDADFTRA